MFEIYVLPDLQSIQVCEVCYISLKVCFYPIIQCLLFPKFQKQHIIMSLYTSTNSQHRVKFKVVVVGDRGVGKSSLVLRYVRGVFNVCYAVTVGVEYYLKNICRDEESYSLQLWDTAGQEVFRSLVKSFYNRASCVILTYCSPLQMEKKIRSSLDLIREDIPQEASIFIVRTKTDLCEVKEEQKFFLDELVGRGQISGWRGVSAKQNQNVDEFFGLVSDQLIDKFQENVQFRQLVEPSKITTSILTKSSLFQSSWSKNQHKKKCCQ